jgi:hypothetical protein
LGFVQDVKNFLCRRLKITEFVLSVGSGNMTSCKCVILKPLKVIKSCETIDQIYVSFNYLLIFNKVFDPCPSCRLLLKNFWDRTKRDIRHAEEKSLPF